MHARLLVLTVLLGGLLAPPSPSAAQSIISDPATGAVSFEPGPCPFWSAEESARYRVECGKLMVPESEVGGRLYRLQVAILRSHGERLHNDAIVVIPGGPGGSMIREDAARLARHPLQDALRQHRDIVLLDPRGTGYSEPGELCPVSEGMQVRAAFLRLPVEDRSAFVRRELEACRARLQGQGIDPGQFNSVALARDLEWLRRALGYEQLNLIGLSWGTRVVLETMRRFPESVRSAILYGPLPPGAWAMGSGAEQVGRSLERLFVQCTADEQCREEFPSLEREFGAMLSELDANPIPLNTHWGRIVVDGAAAQSVVSHALFHSDFLPYVPLAIRELRRRNAAFVEVFLRSAIGEGMSGGFYYAARCFELAPSPPIDSLQRIRERYPWLDHSSRFVPDPAELCDAFIPPSADSTVLQPVRSDIPTLIFAGEFDPATPPAHGRRAAATLSNAHLLVVRGKSHDVNVPIPCTVRIRAQFLEDPLQPPDTSCVAALPPLSFVTDVHANAGVTRLVGRLAAVRDPKWITGTGLLLLSLLVGTVLLPVSLLRGSRRAGGRGAALATSLLWAAAAVPLLFATGLAVALWTAGDPYLPLFGVPGVWGWLFVLPSIEVALAAVGAIALAVGWRRRWWSPRSLTLLGMVAVAGVVFVLVAVWVGLL